MGKVYSKGKVHSVSVMGGVQLLRRQRSRSPRDSPGSPSSQSFSSDSITSTDSEISFDEDDGFKTLVEQKKAQFAKAGYMFPISEKEIDRLQTLHYMFRYFWGNNFSSPMEGVLAKENAKILDIGWVKTYNEWIGLLQQILRDSTVKNRQVVIITIMHKLF